MKTIFVVGLCIALSACDKLGAGGGFQHLVGNWAEIHMPPGCVAKQISAEETAGVAVLCEDGRVFH